jgi:hypothetical protein
MRKQLVVLGAGTAGTMVVNKLRRRLDRREWAITVVDRDDVHHYRPGYLFVPFGDYSPDQVTRSRHAFLPDGVDFVIGEVDRVDVAGNAVLLADGRQLGYDQLVIASGTTPRPDQTPGMLGPEWRRSIFDFYTLDGASALADALFGFDHGRLVVHITETWSSPSSSTPGCASAGCGTGWSWSTSRRCPARSPCPSPPGGSARCSTSARSRWRPTSSWSTSTSTARRWSPTTSARCPSTCWSPCR